MNASELIAAVERLLRDQRIGDDNAKAREIINLVVKHQWAAGRVDRPGAC